MANDIREIPLDDVSMLSDKEINQKLADSELTALEQHLEAHFIWFRRFYGFLGFERARDAVNANDTTKAALELMQTMVEVITSDEKLHKGLTANEVRKAISSPMSITANKRWHSKERDRLMDEAVLEVERNLDAGNRPNLSHSAWAECILKKPTYSLLAGTKSRRKLRERFADLYRKRGLWVRGTTK
jgi:hypothetical protein